ncbi:MAG: 50S ribosomal protein L10 [Candidatus Thorarchaeota archaeon]
MSTSQVRPVQHQYSKMKIKQIEEIVELATQYKTIGLTRLDGISSSVLQNIKKSLRGSTVIKISKNTLKKIALDEVIKKRPQIKKLLPHINNSLAFVFSNENPYKLMKFFDKNRVNVAAKPGQVVQQEVWVNAGPTDFNPGPIISEFNASGIRTSVQQGKVYIQKDVRILNPGDQVTEALASIMSKLGLKPIKTGISLNYILDAEGNLFTETDLSVDDEKILNDLKTVSTHAFNLSIKISYVTKQNIGFLLMKSKQEAINLSLKSGYTTKDTIIQALALTNLKAKTLESKTTK